MTWGVRLVVAGDWCSLWFLCLCLKIDGTRYAEIHRLGRDWEGEMFQLEKDMHLYIVLP